MIEKRRDNKGRVLRNGEVQRPDGKYMFRYTDAAGARRTVYSWKLVDTDKLKEGQRGSQSLRDKEKRILRDIDDKIKTNEAEHITVDDLFQQFMDIRTDLKESSRCCYADIYRKHIKPAIGGKPIGKIKPTEIQKLYQSMVNKSGVNPTTAQKAHSIIYQIFENAVMDDIIRVNPASNAFRNFRKTANLSPACREPLTIEQQTVFIDYIYSSKQYNRFANLFTVLLGTGMRIGEALGLRWCDCDFEEGIIHVTHILLYKRGEDGNYRYRISSPKTVAGNRDIPMFDDVKAALIRERDRGRKKRKKFVVDGYTDFIFLNSNGQVYTQAFIYDVIQGITASYNKEEYAKALEENRQPCYLPKISAHILRHTFCTRMCENDVNIKVLQDIMGHRNIRTTMETYAKALKDKKVETIQALNGAFKIS
ncbi:MAG: site-specific integrase [Oscillospiraceae bacterium]|nr:site-specific integrase [Oscillospiraceae bacterium]